MEVNRRLIIKWLAAMATWPGKALAKIKVACYTGSDVSGPFFRPDAPFRHDLTFDPTSFRGAKTVIVSGTIFGDDCQTPLVGATVEIWQADPKGKYDMESDLFRGRARILTDSEGKYWFRTYMPGYYTDAGLARPKHIHYVVQAPKHKPLTTQLYFKGDKRLLKDPFVQTNDGLKRAFDYSDKANGDHLMTFDIYLRANS